MYIIIYLIPDKFSVITVAIASAAANVFFYVFFLLLLSDFYLYASYFCDGCPCFYYFYAYVMNHLNTLDLWQMSSKNVNAVVFSS